MTSSASVPDRKMQVRIDTEFGEHYIRTKHSNLRCFPRCAVLHVEHRFCGRPIQATVILDDGVQTSNRDFVLVGELHNEQTLPVFELGQKCSRAVLDQMRPKVFIGQEIGRTASEIKCILPPPRKWHLPGKLRSSYRHVCQVYVISNDVVVATAISKSFRISPVWRPEEDTSSVEQGHSGVHVNLRRISGTSDVTHPPKRMQMEERDSSPYKRIPRLNDPQDSQSLRCVETQPVAIRFPPVNDVNYGTQVGQMPMQSMVRLLVQASGIPPYDPQVFKNVRARQTVTGPFPRVMMPSSNSGCQDPFLQSRIVYNRPVVYPQMPFMTQHNASTRLNMVPNAPSMPQLYMPRPSIGSPAEFLFPLVQAQQNACCTVPYQYFEPPRSG